MFHHHGGGRRQERKAREEQGKPDDRRLRLLTRAHDREVVDEVVDMTWKNLQVFEPDSAVVDTPEPRNDAEEYLVERAEQELQVA